MSGPKGYEVRVAEAARRLQVTATARARCSALAQQRATTADRVASLGVEVGRDSTPPLEQLSLEQLQALGGELAREIASLLTAERGARIARARRQLAATFELSGGAITAAPTAPTARTARGRTSQPAVDTEKALASLARTLDRIAHLDEVTRQELTEAAGRAKELLEAGQALQADAALLSLQTRCERASRDQRERERVLRQAQALAVQAADLEGQLGQEVRDRAVQCTSAAELAVVTQLEHEVRVRLEAERDRQFIVRQTQEALRELGYEVGEEMVELAGAEPVVVRRPDLPDHGVEITFAARAPRVMTRVVALGETTPQRDVEAEEITCQDLMGLGRRWAARGVVAELYSHSEPGTVAVKRASDSPTRSARRAVQMRTLP